MRRRSPALQLVGSSIRQPKPISFNIFPALTLLTLLILCLPAHAQFRASIQGTVTDTTGGVISGATLTLTDTDTNRVLTATSNESGVYNFNALAPDHYNLSIGAKGFTNKTIENLHIIPEQSNAVDIQMELGTVGTVVNVTGDTLPALETATASTSATISSEEIQRIPSANRDVFQLVQLAPGVFGDGAQGAGGGTNALPGTQGPGGSNNSQGIFATENGPQAVANGGQYESNGISIDGISTVSAVWGGTSVVTPSEDSIGSIKIVSNNYDAENGRFSGAQIQVTSKAGTNDWHGSFFWQFHRPGFNAYQRYNGPGSLAAGTPNSRGLIRDTQQFNQFGGSVGGPVWKNRMFAFFAYETERNNSSVTVNEWYETPDFHALAPANSVAAQFLSFPGSNVNANSVIEETCANAGLVEGVNCHYIPGKGLNLGSPLTTPLGSPDQTYVNSSNPGVGNGLSDVATVAFYNTRNPTSQIFEQYNGRFDVDATKRDHISFAIYWVPSSTSSYQGSVRPQNLFHHSQTNDAFSGIWNHIFSATLLNEARANAAGWRYNELASNPQEPFGLPQVNIAPPGAGSTTQVFGSIQSQNVAPLGAPGPAIYNQWTYTYKDIMTKIEKNHSIKFGGEVTRLYYLNDPLYAARPSYNFFSYWNFLNDAPAYETGYFSPLTGTPTTNRQDERQNLYGFFVQDDWKAAPNLTINLGLRYSYFQSPYSKENNLNTVIFGSGSDLFTGMSIREGGGQWTPQKGNFGPQFGAAWTPSRFNNRFVVRGGFGLNFNQQEIAISGNAGSNPPSIISANFQTGDPHTVSPEIVYGIAPNVHSIFGFPANPNTVSGFNAQNLPLSGTPQVVAFPNHLPTIYSYHYSLDTQTDLGYNMVLTVGYQGGLGRHIITQQNRYATAIAEGIPLNPLLSAVDYFSNNASSNNNALLVGIKHQMAKQFSMDAEFQWAKSMDQGSGPYFENPYPFDYSLYYGPSDFNVSKAFKVYGVWSPMLWHGNSFVGLLVNGWSVSGIFNLHTGFPWNPVYNTGSNIYYAQSNYNQLRPAAYLGGAGNDHSNDAYKSGPGVGNGVNKNFPLAATDKGTAYYTVPTISATLFPQLPGVGRNSLVGPGYRDVDGTLTKSFALPHGKIIGEHAAIEIRADAFNLFNNLNFNSQSITNDITSPTFGQAQSALSARIINLQARFAF